MRPFLHWEYKAAKADSNRKALNRFRNAMTEIAAAKIGEYPVPIDDMRDQLDLLPHPDTILGLPDSRGAKYPDAPNVDLETDTVKPEAYDQALGAYLFSLSEADRIRLTQ